MAPVPAGPPPSPVAATVIGKSRFLFPSLQLSGSTDASAKFKAAIGYAVGTTGRGNLSVWPRIESASSKGLTTLFSSRDDESQPVQIGLVVNYSLPELSSRCARLREQRAGGSEAAQRDDREAPHHGTSKGRPLPLNPNFVSSSSRAMCLPVPVSSIETVNAPTPPET